MSGTKDAKPAPATDFEEIRLGVQISGGRNMDMKHVEGKNKGHIVLYALSTCGWCRKTKRLLNQLGVEYYYTDVDLLKDKEKDEVMKAVKRHNPKRSFPTMVIDDQKCIVGYEEDRILKEIGGGR